MARSSRPASPTRCSTIRISHTRSCWCPRSCRREDVMSTVLELTAVAKTFTMHLQGGVRLPVVTGVAFAVRAGECAVLAGRSGAGKSSILKMIFGTYRCDAGSIRLHVDGCTVDIAQAEPRQILLLRARALGYVSQFLRAGPRVPTVEVVAEPLVIAGVERDDARRRAADLLRRLNIPERLWPLPPATFSGGAARQHRPRLHIRSAASSARRT